MRKSTKNANFIICLSCYIFLSFAIFNPLFSRTDFALTLFFCIVTSAATIILFFLLNKKCSKKMKESSTLAKVLSVLATISGVFSVLLLMTEVIKDTCYIAGKGVSREYYLFFSLALLSVSLYLCFNSEKGIFRFCFLSIIPILIFTFSALLPFFSVKGIIFDFYTRANESVISPLKCGIIYGLFLSFDVSVFLFCFSKHAKFKNLGTRWVITALFCSIIVWCINYLCVYLIFGKNLVLELDDPLYALTKSFHGFDITETLSALRIIAFIIKSSVYLYACSLLIKKAFFSRHAHSLKIILPVVFALIPLVYLPYLLISHESYGKMQEIIYPSVIIMSGIFTVIVCFSKKQE